MHFQGSRKKLLKIHQISTSVLQWQDNVIQNYDEDHFIQEIITHFKFGLKINRKLSCDSGVGSIVSNQSEGCNVGGLVGYINKVSEL